MAVLYVLSVFILGFGLCQTEESVFDEVLGKSTVCEDVCLRTYPLHTYDEPSSLEACNRGCRLFSICEWADDDSDFNKTVVDCTNACDEAYDEEKSDLKVSACKVGCKSAVSPAKQRKSSLQKEEPHIQLLIGDSIPFMSHSFQGLDADPFESFFHQLSRHSLMSARDSMMENMFGFVKQFMQSDSMISSMMSLGDRDTDEIVIISFNSNFPEINTQHPLEKFMKHNTDGNKVKVKTTLDQIIESNLQTNLYERHTSTDDYWYADDYFDDNEYPTYGKQFTSWWNCFVKKAGLPEIALLLFWISTMILLLMCCTMQFSSRKESEKLSIKGDLAFIKETKGRIPDFLRVYGDPDIVRFTECKSYKPDEKIPLSIAF